MNKISDSFQSLPRKYKGVLLGLSLSTIGLFLPWYSDVDSFNSGVSYSAVTGPASMIGITLAVINLVLVFLVLYSIRKKREVGLPISRRGLEKWSGPIYLYSAFILFSVYFHTDFGINITSKSTAFGAYVGIVGAIITTYSAFAFQGELSHVNPSKVEDVAVDEDPEIKENWEKQRELEQRILKRQGRVIGDDNIDDDVETVEQDSAGTYMYKSDL